MTNPLSPEPAPVRAELIEPRVYSDRELIELFGMLLRAQIREERINSFEELRGLLRHVDAALSASDAKDKQIAALTADVALQLYGTAPLNA